MYETREDQKIPTIKGVSLTLSRCLVMEGKKEEIDCLYKKSLEGKLDRDEYVMHLGGGIQITISFKYHVVDIRHFWKHEQSDKPVATKKGISLNQFKWERLCDIMELIRDFVPEIDQAYICTYSHNNEIELSACKECNPFGLSDEEEEQQQDVAYYDISPNQEGDFEIMKNALI